MDRRVLSADPQSREEPEQDEAKEAPRKSRQDREEQIDGEGDEKELLTTVPISKVGEKQTSQGCPGGVDGRGVPYLGVSEPESGGRIGEHGRYVRYDHHLDAVQDPGNAQGRNYQGMPPAPWQPIYPGGNLRLDRIRFAHS